MKKILFITDNVEVLNRFLELAREKEFEKQTDAKFYYAYSENNEAFINRYKDNDWIKPITVKNNVEHLINEYDIIFSLHSKQLFPEALVNGIKCINIHPGLNPNNRGWFPQVFSIVNGLPCGATIHEIDALLDHGPIICQKEITIEIWDTSLSAYNKILDAEIDLLSEHFISIVNNEYKASYPAAGKLNSKKDFNKLCEIDLADKDSFLNHINKLRALTHGDYANAYFIDEKGNRVFMKLTLIKQQD